MFGNRAFSSEVQMTENRNLTNSPYRQGVEERRRADRRQGRWAKFPGGIWLAALAGLVGLALAIAGLLFWSTAAADRLSLARQEQLVSTVLSQGVAHSSG